jgi:hypothetical protein
VVLTIPGSNYSCSRRQSTGPERVLEMWDRMNRDQRLMRSHDLTSNGGSPRLGEKLRLSYRGGGDGAAASVSSNVHRLRIGIDEPIHASVGC